MAEKNEPRWRVKTPGMVQTVALEEAVALVVMRTKRDASRVRGRLRQMAVGGEMILSPPRGASRRWAGTARVWRTQ